MCSSGGKGESVSGPTRADSTVNILGSRGGQSSVTKVRVRPDEPFEKALRRFKKKCNKEGLMQRLKEMKHFEKPSEKRRRKLAKAVARQAAMHEI